MNIHQIYIDGDANMDEASKDLSTEVKQKLIPQGYNYTLWDEAKLREEFKDDPVADLFLNKIIKEVPCVKSNVFAGDYFRWAVCLRYGGVYLDTDVRVVHTTDIKYMRRYPIFLAFEMNEDGSPCAVAHLMHIRKDFISEVNTNKILDLFRLRLEKLGLFNDNCRVEVLKKLYSEKLGLVENGIGPNFIDQIIKPFISSTLDYPIRVENPINLIHYFNGTWLTKK